MLTPSIKQTVFWKLTRRLFRALAFLRYRNSKPFCATVNHKTTHFHTDDHYSYQWFYPRYQAGQLHEGPTTTQFLNDAKAASVIVDVGANIGWFSCLAAQANPEASIYAFEMDDTNMQLCRKNIHLNQLQNITTELCAISSQNGHITYQKDTSNEASSLYRIERQRHQESMAHQAPCFTLDAYFSDHPCPNLIKIDTEGAEQNVLEGMTSLLSREELTTLYVELHPVWLKELGGSVREVVHILEHAHFHLFALDHRSNHPHETPVNLKQIEAASIGEYMIVARKST